MSKPRHVGFIVDGNRRWARERGLPTLEGHRAGYNRLKEVARWLFKKGVAFASFYLFSRENWHRSQTEVNYLMNLLSYALKHEIFEFERDGIRLIFAGGREQLSSELQDFMQRAEARTAGGRKGTLVACINYGGQQEIVEAVRRLAREGMDLRNLSANDLQTALTTAVLPAADLIIRTSGEQRLSNFLLWESAYAELYFTSKFFPDFTEADLDKALQWFSLRQRRFGV